jgi:hypothetical protein
MGYGTAPIYKDAYLFADFKGKPGEISCKFLRYQFICRDFPAINLFEGIKKTFF